MDSTNNLPVSEFRRLAREGMKGHFWRLWLVTLVSMLPRIVLSLLAPRGLALRVAIYAAYVVLESVMMCGWTRAFVRRLRGLDYGVGTLFWWDRLPRALAVWLALNGFDLLRMLLNNEFMGPLPALLDLALVSVAMFLTLTWGMAPYLWIDLPELGALDVLQRSRETMKGHRPRLLFLEMSFLGWGALYLVTSTLVNTLLRMAMVSIYAGAVVSWLLFSLLTAYMRMSYAAFYEVRTGWLAVEAREPAGDRDEPSGDGGEADAPEPEDDDANMLNTLGEAAWQSPPGAFHRGAPTPEIAMTAEEVAAWDVLAQHGFSHAQMEQDGVIGDYLALGVKPETEVRWRRDYANSALAAFREEGNPAIANAVVRLAVECGDPYALNGALEAMDDAVSAEKIGGMPALEVCANMAAALGSGAFDADAAFLAEARGQVGELVNRLVVRLNVSDPDGAWQKDVAGIRGMLEE